MPSPRRFVESGFRVEVVPGAEAPVRRLALPDPSALLSGGRVLKRSNYRVAARVDLDGVGPVVLKVHRPLGLADVLRGALRPSRARTEWVVSRFLRGAGIPTPEPLLCAVRRRGPLLAVAVSASRFLEGRETFAPALASRPPRQARALLERSGRLVRALHDRGVSHRDLHSGNVLVGEGPADRCELHVIDLHKVSVSRPVGRRARAAQLAQWLHSLAEAVGPGGRLKALLAYLGERPPRAPLRAWWHGLEARVASRERRRLRSRARRCVEENTDFTSDVGEGRGWRRRTLSVADLEGALARHDRALSEASSAVLKAGRKSRVTRDGTVVVKEALSPTWARRLEGLLMSGRRGAGYRNAHALGVRGIATAAPLAWVRRGGRTFTLYEDLSAFPRLDHRVRAALASGAWGRRRRGEVLEATADLAARLHRRGVWHGDLKACNWLVEEGGDLAFHLVDTDRVRFLRRVSRARRLRNLAQLAASIPRSVTRTDRLRWWRRYVRGTDLAGREAERAAARDVARLLAAKRVVVDEPIE